MSRYQKVKTLLRALEKCLMDFYKGVVLLPKFDNSTPETRDKEIFQSQVNIG